MSSKLTKEQAEWLLKRLETLPQSWDAGTWRNDDIIDLINRCIEKEFPNYRFHATYNAIEYELNISHERESPEMIFVSTKRGLCEGSESAYVGFNPDEFKQFTKGCNKIVEWIEAKECQT